MKKINRKVVLGILSAVAVFFFLLRPVGAVNTETVGILPANPDPAVHFSDSWFIYHLGLGASKVDGIRVLNNKSETVVVKLYAVDATTTTDGSFALLAEEDPRKDVGNWVQLGVNEIELPPNSEKTIPFTMKVPDNADVGDHMGGIVMQELESGTDQVSQMGVKIITRVGVRIYETVPGEVKKDFDITRFDWRFEQNGTRNFLKDLLDINRRTVFFTGIQNKGNVRISPKVTIDIKNIFGMTVAHMPDKEMGVIFPRDEIKEGTVIWDNTPFFGRYTVNMTTSFFEDGVGEASRQVVIWVIPYRIIFLLVILVALFFLGRLIRLYFRESSKEKMPIYTVKLGDNLTDLSKKMFVSWKKIAKLNSIGKPFEIRTGEKLFIPVNRKNAELIARMKVGGEMGQSLLERSGGSALKKKRIFLIGIVLVVIVVGAVWGFKIRQATMVHQEIKVPEAQQQSKQETVDKTKSGAFKKSSVSVAIIALPGTSQEAIQELKDKFDLMGYRVRLGGSADEKGYQNTTIEFAPEKKAQAEMMKADLGPDTQVDLREIQGLGEEVVIYSLVPENPLFEKN
jgi:hypothetical protein